MSNPFEDPFGMDSAPQAAPNPAPTIVKKTQKPPEQVVKPALETKKTVVKKSKKAADKTGSEEFLWVLGRFAWGLLKTLFIVGVVVLLFWLGWRWYRTSTDDFTVQNPVVQVQSIEPNARVENPDTSEKKAWHERVTAWFGGGDDTENATQNTASEDPFSSPDPAGAPFYTPGQIMEKAAPPARPTTGQGALEYAARWHDFLQSSAHSHPGASSLEVALARLQNTNRFLSRPVNLYFPSTDPGEKAAQFHATVNTLQGLLGQAEESINQLSAEYDQLNAQAKTAQTAVTQTQQLIQKTLKTPVLQLIDAQLSAYSAATGRAAQLKSTAEARRVVVADLRVATQKLEALRENLVANRRAHLLDVETVSFPGDPFQRIIPQATWRKTQN